MLKKALFILTSILIGFLLVTNGYYICFYNVFQKNTEKAVAAKNYEEAAKYYAYSFDYDDKYEYSDEASGVHIEFYSALNIYARNYEKEDKTKVQYETLESTIQFAMFHLPEDFALTDKVVAEGETPVKGGVELVYGDKTVFFEFMTSELESYYSYAEYYNFLPYTIHYADYVSKLTEKGIALDATTTNIKIYDGEKDTVYELGAQKKLFDTEFHKAYAEVINEYNETKKQDAIKETTSENLTTLVENINKITEEKGFEKQHTVDIIFKSSAFIVRLSLMLGTFLVLDFLVGFLLFRKKKPVNKFVPKRPMGAQKGNGPKLNYQPEQFSRKDFVDVNDEEVSETECENNQTEAIKEIEETKPEE